MAHILGISCSLRNARFGAGSEELVQELAGLETEADLSNFLEFQTKIRADDFIQAGRDKDLPFDEIYRNLTKSKGDRGLSNSEASLAAGLWGGAESRGGCIAPGPFQAFPQKRWHQGSRPASRTNFGG